MPQRPESDRRAQAVPRLVALVPVLVLAGAIVAHFSVSAESSTAPSVAIYLPLVRRSHLCQPIPGERYTTITAHGPHPLRPTDVHPDHNLAMRGYEPTNSGRDLVDYGGPSDARAPHFYDLFYDQRLPSFRSVYQVHDWDWEQMSRGPLLHEWPVTAVGLAASAGEVLYVPDSGYTIGSGYEVLVIYASRDRIALKYTREDNVVRGYTLHVDGVCVEPSLLALYQQSDGAGRQSLPALRPRQPFGRARSDEVVIAIVDHGTFMDPRSRKDWWRGD
jgi:hypothetical protein